VDDTKYKVCEYRNVTAAYEHFLVSGPTYAAPPSPFVQLLHEAADNAALALKDRRRAYRDRRAEAAERLKAA
jgi:hypothetical protein